MTTAPDQLMIDYALGVAAHSTCRSKRGVAIYDMRTGAFRGAGYNGPPQGCPGRAICAGTCGKRSVHAEVRALREAEVYRRNDHPPGPYDLIHVELAADGGVVACDGPSCPGCAAQILDSGFIAGVWLYERPQSQPEPPTGPAAWRRYGAEEFYRVTLECCGMVP